jgi:hypothetical protein
MRDRNVRSLENRAVRSTNLGVVGIEQLPDGLDVLLEVSSFSVLPGTGLSDYEPTSATVDAVRNRAGLDRTAPRYRRPRPKNASPIPPRGDNASGAESRHEEK